MLYLVQKEEIDICDIMLKEITSQSDSSLTTLDSGAEFLALISSLLLLKSRKLLPQKSGDGEVDEPRWELLSKLVEYLRFKEVAKELTDLEMRQSQFFSRETTLPEKNRADGLEEVDLRELTEILHQVLKRAVTRPQEIVKDEEWKVEPKIVWLRELVAQGLQIPFKALFPKGKCLEELIVTFLALLELMKMQYLEVIKEESSQTIFVVKKDASRT